MATYTIIGGDQKEYGPITASEVRKWIAEDRLNAQSMMKAESDSGWRPLSAFPEFADAFAPKSPQPDAPPSAGAAAGVEGDYELDIGGCISSGWALAKNNFGTLFIPILIYFLIEMAFGALGKIPLIGSVFSIANLFISGPLMAGMLYIFIRTIRGEPAELGVMFEGFRKCYWQLFLGYFIPALVYLACMMPFVIFYMIKIIPMLGQFQNATPADVQNEVPQIMAVLKSSLGSSLPVLFICMVPMIYLSVNWQFTLPLIIDRQLDFWTAMKTSWKMVHKHWWQVFGLVVVIGLLNVAGLLACCVGLLFTVPVGFAALMYAYETLFAQSQNR